MKVILLIYVLTIACVSYGQEGKSVVSEEMKKEEIETPGDKKIGEESLQKKQPYTENLDFMKLSDNDTLINKLYIDSSVQEGTKLGIIVVPDLPEEDVDSEYQSQNIFKTKENITPAELTIENDNNTTTEDHALTTVSNLEEEKQTNRFVKFEPQSDEKNDKSFNDDLYILETTTELPTTVTPERKPSNKINKALQASHETISGKNCISKKTFPAFNFETIRQTYTDEQDNEIKRFSTNEPHLKKYERRTFNSWNFLDFGEEKHGSIVKMTKEVPYPVPYHVEKRVPFPVKVEVDRPVPIEVPKPYPVTFEKNIYIPIREYIHTPYPVFRKLPYFIQISVDKPIPIHVSRPYPVYIEKKVPYPVKKQIPIPINIPVDRPIPVHLPFVRNVFFPIEQTVRYPVPISVEKNVPVPVEKPYPVYIEKKVPAPVEEHFAYPTHVVDNKIKSDISQQYSFQRENPAVESFPHYKTEHTRIHGSPEFGVNNDGFVPVNPSTNGYDYTSFQKKRDNEPQESKKEATLQESMTTHLTLEKKITSEGNTNKTYHDFGKKIKNK